MDADLIAKVKAKGLYPLEIDEEAQQRYIDMGFGPSKLEKHFSPGIPESIMVRMERIEKNVLELYQLEQQELDTSEEYQRKEAEVRKDLYELDHPTVEDVLEKMGKEGARTGIVGVNRDIF